MFLRFIFLFEACSPRWWFPRVHQTNCCCWLVHNHLPVIPCSFPSCSQGCRTLPGLISVGGPALCPHGSSHALVVRGRTKTNINWCHWILRCVPAVSPRRALGVAAPSSLPSEISSDRASSTELLVIIYHPGRLAHATRGRLMGHPHAGDLAGVEPRTSCPHDWSAEKWRGGPVIKKRGGTLLIHLSSRLAGRISAADSFDMVLAHLRRPPEERTGLLRGVPRQLPRRCTQEITPLIYPTTHRRGCNAPPLHICRIPQVASTAYGGAGAGGKPWWLFSGLISSIENAWWVSSAGADTCSVTHPSHAIQSPPPAPPMWSAMPSNVRTIVLFDSKQHFSSSRRFFHHECLELIKGWRLTGHH